MSKADYILELLQDSIAYADNDKRILKNQREVYAKQLCESLLAKIMDAPLGDIDNSTVSETETVGVEYVSSLIKEFFGQEDK